MGAIIGGDFFEGTALRVPQGLVSEPANYPRCIAAARGLEHGVKRHAQAKRPYPAALDVQKKCEQLYSATKAQALRFLIFVLWRNTEEAQRGIHTSEARVQKAFRTLVTERFPKSGSLRAYLADRRWTQADEVELVKHDLLSTRYLERLRQDAASKGIGPQGLSGLVHENVSTWTAKTTCQPGYVVSYCREYSSRDAEAGPSAAVLVESFAEGR
jgi:hypothetical protein